MRGGESLTHGQSPERSQRNLAPLRQPQHSLAPWCAEHKRKRSKDMGAGQLMSAEGSGTPDTDWKLELGQDEQAKSRTGHCLHANAPPAWQQTSCRESSSREPREHRAHGSSSIATSEGATLSGRALRKGVGGIAYQPCRRPSSIRSAMQTCYYGYAPRPPPPSTVTSGRGGR